MLDKPLKMPFSDVRVGQLFYLDGRKMVKTDDKLAWSVSNDVRCEVYEPKQDVEVTLADKKIYIPLRTRAELECRAEQIVALVKGKPVVNGDIVGTSYTWDPQYDESRKVPVMKPMADITTFHGYGYYGMFKPSIAEVLAQIPDVLAQRVVAFEIIGRPESAADLNDHPDALNDGYHVATTRLFEAA